MLSSDQTQTADSTATNSWFSDLKQKRDEYNTEIRKKKREDQLKKIRNSNIDIDKKVQVGAFSTLSGSFDTPQNSELKRKINEWFKHQYKVEEFLDLILAINSEDRYQQHYGAIGLRKLLSQEEDPPIQYAVENNVIPRLLQFTQFVNEPHLQLEAAWILTNITSGNAEQTKAVVDHEALPYIISLMKSPQIEIVEQGIWTLGNIAGDSKKLKELVINSGGLEAIVHVVENTQNAGLIKHGIWALSNLCRGRKLPTFDIVNKALPIFAHSVKHTTDTAILIDAVWALSYLSDGDSNQINLVLESGVLESLMRLIKNPNPTILAPVIRTLGNIAASDDEHITVLLQMPNIIEYLFNLLSHQKKVIKKEVCWTLSNITAGNEHHIQAVLGNAACLEKILTVTMTENVDTIREALWILTNATHRCSLEQMVKIAQAGVLDCFCTLLQNSDDAKILEVVLDGINNILRQGDKIANRTDSENPFMIELEQKQLIPRIEELQRHPSIEVYQAAINLLEKHFDLEDDI